MKGTSRSQASQKISTISAAPPRACDRRRCEWRFGVGRIRSRHLKLQRAERTGQLPSASGWNRVESFLCSVVESIEQGMIGRGDHEAGGGIMRQRFGKISGKALVSVALFIAVGRMRERGFQQLALALRRVGANIHELPRAAVGILGIERSDLFGRGFLGQHLGHKSRWR